MPNILSGIPRETTKGVGGLAKVYFAKISDIQDVIIDEMTGEVDFTCAADVWKEIGLSQQSGSNLVETGTGNVGTQTFYTDQALTIILNRRQVEKRNELMIFAKETLCAIAVDEDGYAEFIGKSGMELITGASQTGAQKGEQNGYTLTFNSQEREFAPVVPQAILSALQAGLAVPAV